MSTPENKVKAKVRAVLKTYGVYHFMPATYGYGVSGTPDIICCTHGRFMGIEVKAGKNNPTNLQLKALNDIAAHGGVAVIVNETGIDALSMLLDGIKESPAKLYDLRYDE